MTLPESYKKRLHPEKYRDAIDLTPEAIADLFIAVCQHLAFDDYDEDLLVRLQSHDTDWLLNSDMNNTLKIPRVYREIFLDKFTKNIGPVFAFEPQLPTTIYNFSKALFAAIRDARPE